MVKRKTLVIWLTIASLLLVSGISLIKNGVSNGLTAENQSAFLPVVIQGRLQLPTPPPGAEDWPMAGANVERTSWSSEEVRGELQAEWFTHFDAYLSQKVQIVAAIGYLYISASDGLHALDAENGDEIWFYPTELPLGHSPTYLDGVVYVGGMDRKIHAIDAQTGASLWTYTAEAGFHTNPLVVDDKLYAGNRDGYFYAIYTQGTRTGELAWRYQTQGPILYSAAYKDGVVFFASNDMHAYALEAQTGNLVWQSEELTGNGFHSFWPVVYNNFVVFSGSWNYRLIGPGPNGDINRLERPDVYPPIAESGDYIGPTGHEPGDWADGTLTINASAATQYFEEKPYRRTYFVLNRFSGQEYTFDYDQDGKLEYAPILYYGAQGGTRYPPAIGPDGVIYQANNYIYQDWICRGQVSGWKLGTPFISIPTSFTNAVDEPLGYSIGGNVVYARLCCEREAKAFDLATGQGWNYYGQGGTTLRRTLPELFELGWEFSYWKHGDPSAPVPYNGRVYIVDNNAVVAFSADGKDPVIPPGEDLGSDRGIPAEELEKSTVVTGLNTKVTLDNTAWPLWIYQERYYEQSSSADVRSRYSRLFEIAGAATGTPTSLEVQSTHVATHFTSTFLGSQKLHTWVSNRTPTVLLENTNNVYHFRGGILRVAYLSASGIQVVGDGVTIQGSEMQEGWLLVWDDTDEHRWMPVVFSLQNRPGQVVVNADGLVFNYSGAAGYLGVTPLYGMSSPLSGEVTSWLNGIPQATLDRVRLLNRIAREFPQDSTETRSIDSNTRDVLISTTYQYLQYPDAWNTPAMRLAYLPPTLALAAWDGSPILVNEQPLSSHMDLGYVTPLGRIAGVVNADTVNVRLPGLANVWRGAVDVPPSVDPNDPLLIKLVAELQEMIASGHLRPGYGTHGLWDSAAASLLGQYLADYYHNPAEMYYTLLMALPLLPADLRGQVEQYLQSEFQAYPPYDVSHIGWVGGSSRNYFDLPPEVEDASVMFGFCGVCNSWGFPGENIYASYLYANYFGGASNIFTQVQDKLDELPDYVQSFPNRLNSKTIGYIGYLRLAQIANVTPESSIENYLVDLLISRAALSKYPNALSETGFEYGGYKWSLRTFAPSQPDTLFTPRIIGTLWSQMPLYGFPLDNRYGLSGGRTGGGYAFGIDFFPMVPELADFLGEYAYQETYEAVYDYATRAPYWFVAEAEEIGGEGVIVPVYDVVALFQAKALILQESRSELEKYLDIPITKVGDLYYMLNLVATINQSP